MKGKRKIMAFWLRVLGAGLLAAVLIGGVWWWKHDGFVPLTAVGRGEPLPAQSTARIDVVEEGVPLGGGASATAVIGEPAGEPMVASATVVAEHPLDDVTGLKLGTTLALLTQAYANGGVMARSLANTAVDLADNAGSRDLRDAVAVLRQGTPLTGPMTVTALVAEGQRIAAHGAPKDLLATDASGTAVVPAPEVTSWWRRQIEKFVTIRRGDEPTVDQWTRQMLVVQQQVARGHASDAKLTLEAAPLADDLRLDMLRSMVREYLEQQTALANAMNAYVRAYLAVAPEEAR